MTKSWPRPAPTACCDSKTDSCLPEAVGTGERCRAHDRPAGTACLGFVAAEVPNVVDDLRSRLRRLCPCREPLDRAGSPGGDWTGGTPRRLIAANLCPAAAPSRGRGPDPGRH